MPRDRTHLGVSTLAIERLSRGCRFCETREARCRSHMLDYIVYGEVFYVQYFTLRYVVGKRVLVVLINTRFWSNWSDCSGRRLSPPSLSLPTDGGTNL